MLQLHPMKMNQRIGEHENENENENEDEGVS